MTTNSSAIAEMHSGCHDPGCHDGATSFCYPPGWALNTVRLLSFFALCVTCFLAWSAFQVGDIAGCGGGGIWDCGHVLQSRWSKFVGIPVSIPAAALYASMFVSLMFVGCGLPNRVRNLGWSLVTILALAAGSAALWFISLQIFVLGHLCKYCMVAHFTGLLIAGFIVYWRPLGAKITSVLGSVGLAAASILMLGQVLVEPPATYAIDYYESAGDDPTSELEVVDFEFDDDEFSSSVAEEFSSPAAEENVTGLSATVESPLADSDESIVDAQQPTIDPESQAALNEQPTDDFRPVSEGLGADIPNEPTTPTSIRQEPPQKDGHPPVGSPTTSLGLDVTFPLATLTPQPPVSGTATNLESGGSTPATSAEPRDDGQVPSDSSNSQAEPETGKRLIMYPGIKANLNVAQWPMLGSEAADTVVVELFDYTCSHCRAMNRHIEVARERFGDQLAVIVLPVPLSSQCNDSILQNAPVHAESCELARLALAVWRSNPDVFPVFHRWLFAEERNRTASEARAYAETLVDPTQLREHLADTMIGKFINRHVALYKRAGKGTLPKLFTEKLTLRGQMGSSEELCSMLENQLGLQPISTR